MLPTPGTNGLLAHSVVGWTSRPGSLRTRGHPAGTISRRAQKCGWPLRLVDGRPTSGPSNGTHSRCITALCRAIQTRPECVCDESKVKNRHLPLHQSNSPLFGMLPALIAITRAHERTAIARASRRHPGSPSLLLLSSLAPTTPRRQFLSTSPVAMESGSSTPIPPAPKMVPEGKEGKEAKLPSRPAAVQIKVPKGTRDWSGAELVVRQNLLYVLVATPFPDISVN